jgi:hypothetical protein
VIPLLTPPTCEKKGKEMGKKDGKKECKKEGMEECKKMGKKDGKKNVRKSSKKRPWKKSQGKVTSQHSFSKTTYRLNHRIRSATTLYPAKAQHQYWGQQAQQRKPKPTKWWRKPTGQMDTHHY